MSDTATTTQTRNGVDVDRLVQTIGAIQAQPELAAFRFRAKNRWQGGARSRTTVEGLYGAGQQHDRSQRFTVDGDEPPVLLGEDSAPNAVEAVLHALASCLSVGFIYNAAAQGIEVRSLEFDLEGEMDLHGFLGLNKDVRAGYQRVTVTYRVDCDASPEKVDELCAYVQSTSPVVDILRNPVELRVRRA